MREKKPKKLENSFAAAPLPVEQIGATRERADRARADFLRVDLQTALTFSGIALSTSDGEKKQRTLRAARRAYDSIGRLVKKVELDEAEAHVIDRDLQRLRSELIELGERL